MRTLGNTLYITTQHAFAHLESETVRIDVGREKRFQVPLHHVGSVVCFGNVLLSPALVHRLADDGKAVVLLTEHGRFKARVEGPISGNVLLRQAQHQKTAEPAFCLTVARAIVAGKIKNARELLLRGARESSTAESEKLADGAQSLGNSIRQIAVAHDLDGLRGIEGYASRAYFGALPSLVRAESRAAFHFGGRTRRPPRDRMNALLSFLYSMLMNDCRSATEAAGLDPQLGFFHAIRPGRASFELPSVFRLTRVWFQAANFRSS